MVVFDKRAFNLAQEVAKGSVDGGSNEGFQFDWEIAMFLLKVAYGHAPIEQAEAYYKHEG